MMDTKRPCAKPFGANFPGPTRQCVSSIASLIWQSSATLVQNSQQTEVARGIELSSQYTRLCVPSLRGS